MIRALPFRGEQDGIVENVAQSENQLCAAFLQRFECIENLASHAMGFPVDN